MLLISVGLHAILLLTPLPSEQPAPKKVEAPKAKPIKITVAPPPRPKPKPIPKVRRQPVIQRQPLVSLPSKKLTPAPSQNAASATPDAKAQQTPTPAKSNAPESEAQSAWANFPKYPNLVDCTKSPGCFQTNDAFKTVVQFFQKEAPAKKFGFDPQDQTENPSYAVFKVTNAKQEAQYLSLLELEEGGTLYILAEAPVPADTLLTGEGIAPPEFAAGLANLVTDVDPLKSDVTPERLPDAAVNTYYTSVGGQDAQGFDIAPSLNPAILEGPKITTASPTETFQALSGQLTDYAFTPQAGGSAGQVYEVKRKGSTNTHYLTLLPTKEGNGTIVTFWSAMP